MTKPAEGSEHRAEPDPGTADSDDAPDRGTPAWLRWAAVGVGILMAILAVTAISAAWSVRQADDDDLPPVADAIVVFAGETARTELALELLDDEVAPVAVFSLGANDRLVSDRCGEREPIEVMCPTPTESNTRSEAQLFAQLAHERGWTSLVAVTGNYHLARARTWLTRCYDADVSFTTVDWDDVSSRVYAKETAGLWVARFIDRSC